MLTHNLSSPLDLSELTCDTTVTTAPESMLLSLQRKQQPAMYPRVVRSGDVGGPVFDRLQPCDRNSGDAPGGEFDTSIKDRLRVHLADAAASRILLRDDNTGDLLLDVEEDEEELLPTSGLECRTHSSCCSDDDDRQPGTGKRTKVKKEMN